MRGAAVTLAERCADLATRPDVVLVSDMLDVAAFRTFSRPHLGDVPTAVYFHETQLTYPDSPQMAPDLHYAFTNWTSALAADRVFFNSRYHYEVFFAEVGKLLRHFPDFTHEHLVERVREKSEVLEVGVDMTWIPADLPAREGPVRIVWNHRWEHDKDPAAFFAAVDRLAADGVDFELVVCGENSASGPTSSPRPSGVIGRIVHMGHLETDDYRRHLLSADVVVSTARQEFFDLGRGGRRRRLLPRVASPALLPEPPAAPFPRCLPHGPGELAERLRWVSNTPQR